MLNEGKGISDIIKGETDKIWVLFLDNSYSNHRLTISDKDYDIEFVQRNNYYPNIKVDRTGFII